ncbi:hypothetical protein GCM10010510_69640 [Streptomyces anandii JCM 4720]|nr:hypothetical protein GCM10010510_69640 [Streptomyces anandii JCM 4720]
MDLTDFPDDLVQTQTAWNDTYQALAAPRPRNTTALRRRLLLLSVRLGGTPTGRRPLGAGGTVRAAPPHPRQRSRPGRVTRRSGRPGARGCAKSCARCTRPGGW